MLAVFLYTMKNTPIISPNLRKEMVVNFKKKLIPFTQEILVQSLVKIKSNS